MNLNAYTKSMVNQYLKTYICIPTYKDHSHGCNAIKRASNNIETTLEWITCNSEYLYVIDQNRNISVHLSILQICIQSSDQCEKRGGTDLQSFIFTSH